MPNITTAAAASAVSTNTGVVTNSIMGAIAASPTTWGISKFFRIQPQRLVKLDGSPGVPYTVQNVAYKGSMAMAQNSSPMPFPNPLFSTRAQVGPGYFLQPGSSAQSAGSTGNEGVVQSPTPTVSPANAIIAEPVVH